MAEQEETEDTPEPAGRFARLKARLLAVPAALRARFKRQPAEDGEKDGEEVSPAETADEAAAPPRWRRPLMYGGVLALGTVAGAGLAYLVLAQRLAHQSAELARQQEELAQHQSFVAGYDKLLLQERKKAEEETAKRQAEEARRLAAEQRLAQLQAEPGRPLGAAPAQVRISPAAPQSAPRPGQAPPPKSGACDLRPGNIGAALKGCIDEFNRQ